MLWILGSLFFFWLIAREILRRHIAPAGYDRPDSTPLSFPYLAVLLLLALACAWPPFHVWRLERMLSAKATILADGRLARVHCNTVFDTFFDSESLAAGHANPARGDIVFQYPWCQRLMDYLAHPQRANREEIISLHIFTHESMHVRGELNEAAAECQAVQRNARTATLLGVSDSAARRSAQIYYRDLYLAREVAGPMSANYFSAECAPGKAMDERVDNSIWARGDKDLGG